MIVGSRLGRAARVVSHRAMSAFAALVLALLATLHRLDLSSLVLLSALNSAANGFDSPVRQNWVPLLLTGNT